MRRWTLALLFLVACASASVQQPASTAVDIVVTRVHIPVSVNGAAPATFILDTGAAGSAIDPKYAESLGIKARSSGTARGAGGSVKVGLARDVEISFAGLRAELERSPMTPLGAISLRIGQPVHGVLGYDVMRKYVTEIDYAHERVTFHPLSFELPAEAVRVPIRFEGRLPLIDARLVLPDGRELRPRLLVDTGAGSGLILTRAYVAKNDIELEKTLDVSGGMGVGGETSVRIGRISSLQLAGVTLDNPIAALSRDTRGVFAASEFDGLIGGPILRRFTLYVDYPRKEFAFLPNAALKEPFEADASGLGLSSRDDSFEAVVIREVLPHSPAAEIGLRPGDELLAIDGKPVVPAQMDEIRETFRRRERTFTLRIRRDGAESTVTLVTRRLI